MTLKLSLTAAVVLHQASATQVSSIHPYHPISPNCTLPILSSPSSNFTSTPVSPKGLLSAYLRLGSVTGRRDDAVAACGLGEGTTEPKSPDKSSLQGAVLPFRD